METIKIVKSNRKTFSLEVKRDGSVILRAPLFATNRQIEEFYNKNKTNDTMSMLSYFAKVIKDINTCTSNKTYRALSISFLYDKFIVPKDSAKENVSILRAIAIQISILIKKITLIIYIKVRVNLLIRII